MCHWEPSGSTAHGATSPMHQSHLNLRRPKNDFLQRTGPQELAASLPSASWAHLPSKHFPSSIVSRPGSEEPSPRCLPPLQRGLGLFPGVMLGWVCSGHTADARRGQSPLLPELSCTLQPSCEAEEAPCSCPFSNRQRKSQWFWTSQGLGQSCLGLSPVPAWA